MSLLYSSESPSSIQLCQNNGSTTDCSPCFTTSTTASVANLSIASPMQESFDPISPASEDPRIEVLRLYSYGVALPSICLLGIIGNIFNLIVLTRRNMRGTAYIYMRGESIHFLLFKEGLSARSIFTLTFIG